MRKVLSALAAVVGTTILAVPASAHLDTKVHANNLRVCNNRCLTDVSNVSVDVLP